MLPLLLLFNLYLDNLRTLLIIILIYVFVQNILLWHLLALAFLQLFVFFLEVSADFLGFALE